MFGSLDVVAEVSTGVTPVIGSVRGGAVCIGAGAADVFGVFGIPAVAVNVGDAITAVRGTVEDVGGTEVVGTGFCASAASAAALSFFSRAAFKSSCRKSSPEDRRLGVGFDFCRSGEGGAEIRGCTGA